MSFTKLKNKRLKKPYTLLGLVFALGLISILSVTITPYSFAQTGSILSNTSNAQAVNTSSINTTSGNNQNSTNNNTGESLIIGTTIPNKELLQSNFATAENASSVDLASDNNSNLTNASFGQINQNVSLSSYSKFVNDINSLILSKESSINAGHTTSNNLTSSNSNSGNSVANSEANSIRTKLLSLHEIVLQNTSMSAPAPVRHPGQPPHEVVFALPLRNDGKIWTGTVTFTASKPIEVEVLHNYSPLVAPDSVHRAPYNAVLPGNNSIAITHLRHLVDVPFEINGTGISSGTLDFAGNALVFHKTTGEPFTVTYTLDAVAKKLTSLK
jgi:hypothetical protein